MPRGQARVVYHIDGHGNEGPKLDAQSSGAKTWYFRARVRGSDPKDMPLGRWPDVSIGEACKRKNAIVASISEGVDPWQKRAEERRRKKRHFAGRGVCRVACDGRARQT